MAGYEWMIALVIGIFAIEFLSGRHRAIHHRQDHLILATALLGAQVTRPVVAILAAALLALLLPAYQGALAALPFWIAFPALVLIGEFWQYWLHRAAHDSVRHKVLSGMHRTHHSAPYVNITVIFRANLIWAFIHPYAWTTAIAFYLGQPVAATAFYLTIFTWNMLTHTDWRWDDHLARALPGGRGIVRALEWVFITPRMHHAHHGYGKDGRAYTNFSTMISLYDRLFGSLFVPQGRPLFYGLPGGEHVWFRQMLYPLVPLGEARKYRAHRKAADVEAERLARRRRVPSGD
jgi:sterol desaturase/sphingolipid hydroxylase (fatty acid hydroxylase superfamily)